MRLAVQYGYNWKSFWNISGTNKKMTDIVKLLYAVNVYINTLLNIIWKHWLVTAENFKNEVQSISIKRSLFINQSLSTSPENFGTKILSK